MPISQSLKKENNFNSNIRERINYLFTERYIHTPQNAELWCLLEDLMFQVCFSNPKPKVMGCLVTGEPHSGKTTAVRQFKKAYLENVLEAKPNDVFFFQIPSRARLKGVLTQMGRQLKILDIPANPKRGYPTYILTEKVAAKLWKNRVKLVIIDEFQMLFELSGESRIEILSGFNDLVNQSHIPIILVGVAGVNRILDVKKYHSDEANLRGTFCSRFSEFPLLAWDDPHSDDFCALLMTLNEHCNLHPSTDILPFYTDDKIREWILKESEGLTGKIVYLIKWAVRYIIRSELPEHITMEVLKIALKKIQSTGW